MKAEVLKTPRPAAAPSSEDRHRYREFLVAVVVALLTHLAHRRDLIALEGQSKRLGHQMVASFLLVGLTSFVWTLAVPSSTFARILAVQTITWSPAACASMLTVLGASLMMRKEHNPVHDVMSSPLIVMQVLLLKLLRWLLTCAARLAKLWQVAPRPPPPAARRVP